MDVPTSAVVIAGITKATTVLKPFFEKVTGAAGDVVANRISDYFGAKRALNLAKVVLKAQEKAKAEGLDPSKIPLKVIHPMLENASLEEDENLQEMWANLLKSACDSEDDFVSPSFIEVLRQLSPSEARYFNRVFRDVIAREQAIDHGPTNTQIDEPTDNLGMAREIGSPEFAGDMDVGAVVFALSNFNRLGIIVEPQLGQTRYRMSPFGYNFGLAACDVSDLIRRDEVQISKPSQS
jgi:hypothetical protein